MLSAKNKNDESGDTSYTLNSEKEWTGEALTIVFVCYLYQITKKVFSIENDILFIKSFTKIWRAHFHLFFDGLPKI